MEQGINFRFRDNQHFASYAICERDYPTYIYINLKDNMLIKEFGEELVLHSNGQELLISNVYTSHRLDIYAAIFQAITAVETLKDNTIV